MRNKLGRIASRSHAMAGYAAYVMPNYYVLLCRLTRHEAPQRCSLSAEFLQSVPSSRYRIFSPHNTHTSMDKFTQPTSALGRRNSPLRPALDSAGRLKRFA